MYCSQTNKQFEIMSGKYVLFLMMNDYSMTSVQSAHSESNGLVGTSLNVCLITGTLQRFGSK